MNSKQKNAMPIQKGMLIGLALSLLIGQSQAVQPYTPVHPDPVLEEWRWTQFPELNGLGLYCLAEAKDKAMWFGMQGGEIVRFDKATSDSASTYRMFTEKDGLDIGGGPRIHQIQDGLIWTISEVSNHGVNRFDGQQWTHISLTKMGGFDLNNAIVETRDGTLWIPTISERETRTIRYEPDSVPPETEITIEIEEVSQPGNTTLTWKGADLWNDTPDDALQYSYRMDNGDWSPFSAETHKTLLTLHSGKHQFEVQARDRDFNVDPTPASVMFIVVSPVWQQP